MRVICFLSVIALLSMMLMHHAMAESLPVPTIPPLETITSDAHSPAPVPSSVPTLPVAPPEPPSTLSYEPIQNLDPDRYEQACTARGDQWLRDYKHRQGICYTKAMRAQEKQCEVDGGYWEWNGLEFTMGCFVPASRKREISACRSKGGTWQTDRCHLTFTDGGKSCTDGKTCQSGLCLAKDAKSTLGHCPKDNNQPTCGYFYLVNGAARMDICIRCGTTGLD